MLVESLSEHHCAHFQYKKVPVFALIRKVTPKGTVYTLSRFDFFGRPEIFFGGDFFVDSLSEHHSTHFQHKKVPVFALIRKVTPKGTVYRLSRLVFFGPPKIFFRRTIFLLN